MAFVRLVLCLLTWFRFLALSILSIIRFALTPGRFLDLRPCAAAAAAVSLSTILLYAGVYTPLKRISPVNTAVGALVGALPPLIGWFACAPASSASSLAPFVLPALLFAWQYPHFNALSCRLGADYARAGYRMQAVLDAHRNRLTGMLGAAALLPWTWLAVQCGVVDWGFLLTAGTVNGWFFVEAARFYRDRHRSRPLFFASLAHLPAVLGLLFYHRHRAQRPLDSTAAAAPQATCT